MDLKVTITCKLTDKKWGFTDLLNGRELDKDTKEEIIDLIEENIYDAIYENRAIEIVPDTSENTLPIDSVMPCGDCSIEDAPCRSINCKYYKVHKA